MLTGFRPRLRLRLYRLVRSSLYFLILPALPLSATAHGCGWWGDSEMSSRRETAAIVASGQQLSHTLDQQSMKLPGRMGFGIAIPEPGRAIPYLVATAGRPLNSIQDLAIFGFHSVIDLGGTLATASLHRKATEAVGMKYFHIPITGEIPHSDQISLFYRIVINARNGPLLVYAPKVELLGVMWVTYRLRLGAPSGFAIREGRMLGLTMQQEKKIRSLAYGLVPNVR